jgi:hypothetical protein
MKEKEFSIKSFGKKKEKRQYLCVLYISEVAAIAWQRR